MKALSLVLVAFLLLLVFDYVASQPKNGDDKPKKEKRGFFSKKKQDTDTTQQAKKSEKTEKNDKPLRPKEPKEGQPAEHTDELMVADQMEDVISEIHCGRQMQLLSYPETLRLLFRVLNEMIADTLTFGDIVQRAGKKIKSSTKKIVFKIKRGIKRLQNFVKRKSKDEEEEEVDTKELTDLEVVEVAQTHEDELPEDVVSHMGDLIEEAVNAVTGAKKGAPAPPPKVTENGNEVHTRDILLSKTLFRLMVYLTNLIFPDATPITDLTKIEPQSQEDDHQNKAYQEMLSAVVNLYNEVRNTMSSTDAGAPNNKDFAYLMTQIKEMEARADDKTARVSCPTVTMIISSFQDRFDKNNKRNQLVVKGVESGFKLITASLKIAASLGAAAVSSQAGPQAGKLAGEIANGVIDAVWGSLQKLLLSPLKQTVAIKAFRRQIRMVLLSGLQGLILAHSTKVDIKKDDPDDPDETDCYKSVLHTFRMLLLMLDNTSDTKITAARGFCVEDDIKKLFAKNKLHNLLKLKFINFPERYKTILTFLGARSDMENIQNQIKFVDGAGDLGGMVSQTVKTSLDDVTSRLKSEMSSYLSKLKLSFLETSAYRVNALPEPRVPERSLFERDSFNVMQPQD
jgi:hypothetical protein